MAETIRAALRQRHGTTSRSALRRVTVALALACLVLGAVGCTARFEVDGERMHARVVEQVDMGPRIPGTPGHRAQREWMVSELTAMGAVVEVQDVIDTTLGRTLELFNVIGRFGPESDRRILLCAHWDTRPWCDRDRDPAFHDQPLPGANDGGSGVAVLLEIGELMKRQPPPVGVDLVFFDGEDQGVEPEEFSLGAKAFARRLSEEPERKSRIAAAFVFDMVGGRDLQIYAERNSLARAANMVALVYEGADATGASHFHREARYSVVDDHVPLLEAGVPAVDIIDFDYDAWHTHDDVPAQVSPESLAEVARVAAWLVYRSPLAKR